MHDKSYEEHLEAFEQKYDVKVPEDLREFLIANQGEMGAHVPYDKHKVSFENPDYLDGECTIKPTSEFVSYDEVSDSETDIDVSKGMLTLMSTPGLWSRVIVLKGESYGSIWEDRMDFEYFELVARTFQTFKRGSLM